MSSLPTLLMGYGTNLPFYLLQRRAVKTISDLHLRVRERGQASLSPSLLTLCSDIADAQVLCTSRPQLSALFFTQVDLLLLLGAHGCGDRLDNQTDITTAADTSALARLVTSDHSVY